MPFDTRIGNADQQAAWQAEYLTWAASVLERREAAFGPEARYELQRDMSVDVAGAMLPAVYDAARSFISSASRSPVTNAVTTTLGNEGEFSNSYDPAVIGGIAGGLIAYAADKTLLGAMDRFSRLANMPRLEPVDIDALIPEPCPVRLLLSNRDGVTYKRFERVATDVEPLGAPDDASANTSLAALRRTSEERREAVRAWQHGLKGKSWASLTQPVLTGAFNTGRRAWLPESALYEPWQLLGASAVASGAAAASSRVGEGIARSLPWTAQTRVDDLLGGTQRVNLLKRTLPNADVPAAGFDSILTVPRYLLPLVREIASLCLHAVPLPFLHRSWRDLWAQGLDIAYHAVANATASVFAVGTGLMVAQLARGGSLTKLPGEAHNSRGALLQQAVQSATSDYAWALIRGNLPAVPHSLVDSLDRWRALRVSQTRTAQASMGREMLRALNRLEIQSLSAPMSRVMGREITGPLGQREIQRLSQTLSRALSKLLDELNDPGVAGADTLNAAHECLRSAVGSDARILGGAQRTLRCGIKNLQRAGSTLEANERARRAP
jgi:hypothetical protein